VFRSKLSRFAAAGLCLSTLFSLPVKAQSLPLPMLDLLNDPSLGFDPIERIAGQWVESAVFDLALGDCQLAGQGVPCQTPGVQPLFNALRDMELLAGDFFDSTLPPIQTNLSVGPGFAGANSFSASNSFAAVTPRQNAIVKLRDALRACAPEEFSSQRAANTEFTNNQMTAVGSRITALRFGAQGFSVAGLQLTPRGGAASADGESIAQRWGGFLNTAYGWGERDTSPYETGFDFDGVDITLGTDYRFTSQFVAGATVGYFDQTVDFTPIASESRGDIDSKGFNVNLFALYEWDGPYVSGSLGYQQLTHDSERRVKYQLFDTFGNPIGAPVDETETGDTDSSALIASADFGWPLRVAGFGYEPYIRAEYRDMTIDAFSETSVNNIGGGVGAFGVSVPERDVTSVLGAVGVKAQYVFTPSFGVIVPFVSAEYRNEFEDEALSARVTYTAAAAVPGVASSFTAPGDEPDTSYAVASAGATAVFQGGWQSFVQYRRVFALEYITHQTVTLGVRGEF
jgi:outer membrane autotransporter protein